MRRVTVFAALIFGLISTGVAAQEPGDPKAGLEYAKANCSQCHEVERHSQIVPLGNAPGFPDLANLPGMTGRALAAALTTSHKTMPNFAIAAEDRNNVIAYIMNLRSPSQ